MSKDRDDKVLSLTDASAGFVGAVFLFFIQKLPEGSDAKQLMLYSMTVVALAANNIFAILFAWANRKVQRRALKNQHEELEQQRTSYAHRPNADPEVLERYNSALKDTQLALLSNLTAASKELNLDAPSVTRSPARKRMNNTNRKRPDEPPEKSS